MYVDEPTSASAAIPAGAGWQVSPDQVRNFAEAVAQVRADLEAVRQEVEDFKDPALGPKLGTSPPARELAEKFNDRIAGPSGLAGQLDTAVKSLTDFVAGAEQTAKQYQHSDAIARDGFRE